MLIYVLVKTVMKNIVIISSVFPPEPVTSASMNFDLAMKLSECHDVTVLRPRPTRPLGHVSEMEDVTYPFECITLDSYTCPESVLAGRFRESVSFGMACSRYIAGCHGRIDFVYNSSWQLFGVNIVARTCVRHGIPYILPIQDIYPESLFTGRNFPESIKRFLTGILLPIDRYNQLHSAKVRTISEEMAAYLSLTRRIPSDRYMLLDNWQDDEKYSFTPICKEAGQVRFVYVGSVNAHSNTELIINAFREAGLVNAQLHIYGSGNHLDKCREIVRDASMENVLFDRVAKEDVPLVQSSAHVLVLALPAGNGRLCLPSKVTSYMFSGRPLLASVDEDSAAAQYIAWAGCGVTVPPDDIGALAEGFRKYAAMSGRELSEMGTKARHFAERKLSKASNLSEMVSVIQHILDDDERIQG